MPDVIINKQRFYNPADYAMNKIGGVWKMPVLYRLQGEPKRYTELQNSIPHISQKMLTTTLKNLETNGLVSKKIFQQVPPHTEYSLTERGKAAIEVIKVIRDFGIKLMKEEGVNYEDLLGYDKNKK